MASIISPKAEVSPKAKIGDNCKIYPFAYIEDDVVIGVSFPRYSKRTVKAIDYAKERGATVIAITDSAGSPLAAKCDHLLLARSDMASFVDSLVAPLSLINALIMAVSARDRERTFETFRELETVWKEYEVYGTVES